MKYFLDTEFLEGTQKKRILGIPYGKTKDTIDLISIGIVAEHGREFYEVSKDFNLDEAWSRWQQRTGEGDRNNREPREYWIRENVLKPIFLDFLKLEAKYLSKQKDMIGYAPALNTEFTKRNFKRLLKKFGRSNKEIAKDVKNFIENLEYNALYTIHPKSFNHKAIELYAYFADYDWVVFCWLFGKMIDLPKGFPMYCIDLKQILDEKVESVFIDDGTGENRKEGRLEWIKTLPHYPKNKNDHNALSDAKWNLELFEFLEKL